MPTMEQVERYREVLRYRWACGISDCDGLPHEGFPHKHARGSQVVTGDQYIQAWITGRGFGKTRAAAEFVKDRMMREEKHRVSVIAPTFANGRDICVEGESGLLEVIPPWWVANWNRSLGELVLKNGSRVKIFGAHSRDDADGIRGSQSHTVWAEELATWRHQMLAWDMAMFANRLGTDPRVIVTSTPKNTPLIRKLRYMDNCKIVGGTTLENANNLAPQFLKHLIDKYQNTRLGKQELEGVLLEDVAGALWSRDLIRYVDEMPKNLVRIVVAVDPPGGHRLGVNAKCGIVAAGKDAEGLIYILKDKSSHFTPEGWAREAIDLYDELSADAIVAEQNFGGAMVQSTLRSYSTRPNFKMVTASRGKVLRAEPVVNLYERKRVFHVGVQEALEDQMCGWIPPGQAEMDENGIETPIPASDYSPDSLDAMVWAVTDLVLKPMKMKTTMRYKAPRATARGF